MLVAPWTMDSRVSGMATGVHQEMKTGSDLEQRGRRPEYRPSISTTLRMESERKDKSFPICTWGRHKLALSALPHRLLNQLSCVRAHDSAKASMERQSGNAEPGQVDK